MRWKGQRIVAFAFADAVAIVSAPVPAILEIGDDDALWAAARSLVSGVQAKELASIPFEGLFEAYIVDVHVW